MWNKALPKGLGSRNISSCLVCGLSRLLSEGAVKDRGHKPISVGICDILVEDEAGDGAADGTSNAAIDHADALAD